MGWLPNRLPAACGLAYERGASLSGLAAAWLERGANADSSEIRHARRGASPEMKEWLMAAVMIGVDPHKASHTAVAIGAAEEPLGQMRVRASPAQAERLVAPAPAWPDRALAGAAPPPLASPP